MAMYVSPVLWHLHRSLKSLTTVAVHFFSKRGGSCRAGMQSSPHPTPLLWCMCAVPGFWSYRYWATTKVTKSYWLQPLTFFLLSQLGSSMLWKLFSSISPNQMCSPMPTKQFGFPLQFLLQGEKKEELQFKKIHPGNEKEADWAVSSFTHPPHPHPSRQGLYVEPGWPWTSCLPLPLE